MRFKIKGKSLSIKKLSLIFIIFCLFFLTNKNSLADDDYTFKLDTDIITNSEDSNRRNLIEEKYAPNLFLDRTNKFIDEKNNLSLKSYQGLKNNLFINFKDTSIYSLDTKSIRNNLFKNEEDLDYYAMNFIEEEKEDVKYFNIFQAFFLILMLIIGIILGRILNEKRKHRSKPSS